MYLLCKLWFIVGFGSHFADICRYISISVNGSFFFISVDFNYFEDVISDFCEIGHHRKPHLLTHS